MSLLGFQKLVYKKVKKDFLFEKYSSDEIEKYKKRINTSKKKSITEEDLFLKIFSKKIIFVGDFHSYSQYQETFYRILTRSVQYDPNFCLALEMFFAEDQPILDKYLSGKISEKNFLKKINYEEKWSFPWSNYRKIVHFCKLNKIKIYGLNCQGTLIQRDKFAQKILKTINKQQKKIFVLYGEMHLHSKKIPFGFNNSMIIHQNLFDFKKSRFFYLGENSYCVLTTPLWIKLCTEMLWLERDSTDDFSKFFIAKNLKNPEDSLYDPFHSISEIFVKFFDFKVKHSLENYTIYNEYEKKNFLKKIKDKSVKKIFLTHVDNHLAFSYDFNYYSYDLSFDSLCVLIAEHVLKSCFVFPKKKDFNSYFLENFYSYIFSKVINPFRRTLLYVDLLEKKYIYTHDTIRFLFSFKENFKTEEEKYFVARYLGFLVGEYFFLKFSSSKNSFLNEISKIKKKNYLFILKKYLPKNFKEDRHNFL